MASKPPCRASCAGAAAFCVHNFFTAPAVYTQIKGVYNIIMCLYSGRTSKTGRKLHHGAKSTRTPPRSVAERTPPETPYPPRAQLDGLSAQLRRGHGCDDRRHPLAAAQGLCLIAPPTAFEAREYEGGAETDLSDKRLVLVNANLPLTEEPTPELAVADDATGVRWKPRLPQPTAKWPRPQSRMR